MKDEIDPSITSHPHSGNHNKPSIVEVVGQHLPLRRAGKELAGLCPFHAEKTPSFTVNEDKGVFYCHGCHEGGDVIDFVRKLKGFSYREAIAELGMDATAQRPPPDRRLLVEARRLARWADEQTRRAECLLCEIGKRAPRARELRWREEAATLFREWVILETLAEDLQHHDHVLHLYWQREDVEHLLADAVDEPLPEFPELTPEYRAFVKANLPTVERTKNRGRAHRAKNP